jgi:hypothetical protein
VWWCLGCGVWKMEFKTVVVRVLVVKARPADISRRQGNRQQKLD